VTGESEVMPGQKSAFGNRKVHLELSDSRRVPVGGPPQTNSVLKLAVMGRLSLREFLALYFVFGYDAVFDVDDAVRVFGDVVFMGYHYDRIAFRVQTIEQRHDLGAGL
jgi:hypothetical protein